MSIEAVGSARQAEAAETGAKSERPLVRSMLRGFLCRCPHCGEGKLFAGYLRAVSNCSVCDEPYDGLHRADDLPPYLTVFVAGHILVAMFMAADEAVSLSMWTHMAIFIPLTLLMCLGLLRPMKGLTIGLQWSMRMHGFGKGGEAADH